MSGDSIDGLVNDPVLNEFIFAANGCMDDGLFVRDEKYEAVVETIRALPPEQIVAYGTFLQKLAGRSQNLKRFHDLFKAEFDY